MYGRESVQLENNPPAASLVNIESYNDVAGPCRGYHVINLAVDISLAREGPHMTLSSRLLDTLGTTRFPPGYGPEWGSGGIYGLLIHKGVLYFTLAFEARAYFAHLDSKHLHVYDFQSVGDGQGKSGGDSYNASTAVDDKIYFGGWLHAPPVVRESPRGRELDFTNKYSHLHVFDIREDRVRLVWSESIHHPKYWAGEVSEVLYDPLADQVLVARGDGHENLGIYAISEEGEARRISPNPVLKGAIHMDHACFSHHGPGEWKPFRGVSCVELGTWRITTEMVDPAKAPSVDGVGVEKPRAGSVVSAYTRLYTMVRGGVFVGEPVGGEEQVFYRLFDFYPSHYGPLRVNTTIAAGMPVTAWNTMTHSTLVGTDELASDVQAASRLVTAPSILVAFDGPTPRILAALGVRATSIEAFGDELVIGYSTAPNLERYDATRLDAGTRGLSIVNLSALLSSRPPSLAFQPPREAFRGGRAFGGIPLAGYRDPVLYAWSREGARIRVYTYTLYDPPGSAEADTYTIGPGRSRVELSGHGWGIVSFQLLEGSVDRLVVRLL